MKIIGRTEEAGQIEKALKLSRNLLIEGPVGVGKTFLVTQVLAKMKLGYERVDGDTRYTEQKLSGWFDPPMVLKKGYAEDCFIDGPLLKAMKEGKVLFINELNRMPEAVQNILLPAMDEHQVMVPRLGKVAAKKGFCVIATQNPREFTATHALSEALMDRFEMVHLAYQSREEESAILDQEIGQSASTDAALDLVRATRDHEAIKRGASVRAALAIAQLVKGGLGFEEACLMALPSRIEMASSDQDALAVIKQLLASLSSGQQKKKRQ